MQKNIRFRDLLKKLNDIAELRPDVLDFDVIVAINSKDSNYGGCEILDEIDVDDNIKQVWLTSNC
jgi:hypothetical protein